MTALEDTLADCTGPDDPTFRAAQLIADAWQPALDRSYRLGYEVGHADGYRTAEQDMAESWSQMVKDVKATWKAADEAKMHRARSGAS